MIKIFKDSDFVSPLKLPLSHWFIPFQVTAQGDQVAGCTTTFLWSNIVPAHCAINSTSLLLQRTSSSLVTGPIPHSSTGAAIYWWPSPLTAVHIFFFNLFHFRSFIYTCYIFPYILFLHFCDDINRNFLLYWFMSWILESYFYSS